MMKTLDASALDTWIHVGSFEGLLRDYFKELLLKLWNDAEQFSGKRPFGNSGWKFVVYACLIEDGIVEGDLDEYGNVEQCDSKEVDRLITELIVEHGI